jgi:hypothetical protein
MTRKLTFKGRWTPVVAAAALVALASGVAWAAIPSTTTAIITACYDTSGTVRVIDKDAGATCPVNTKQLQWNQQGRTGPTGHSGPAGAPGPAYWVRVAANSTVKAKTTSTQIELYDAGVGAHWIYVPQLDAIQCAVTATPVTSVAGATVQRDYAVYANWIYLRSYNGTMQPTEYDVDVMIACPRV